MPKPLPRPFSITGDEMVFQLLESRSRRASSGCLEWQANKTNGGYGIFSYRGIAWLAHRAAYEFHCGPIPDGMLVCHSCDNRSCVNPDHLHLGDYLSNMREKMSRNRYNNGCKLVSEYSDDEVVEVADVLRSVRSVTRASAKCGVSAPTLRALIARGVAKNLFAHDFPKSKRGGARPGAGRPKKHLSAERAA
jgi:hypothetical protein